MKLLIMKFFSKLLKHHQSMSSLNVRHQVSHPYKTTGKIILLYLLEIYCSKSFLKKIGSYFMEQFYLKCVLIIRIERCDLRLM
jgi:hypothetical protein